MEVTSQMRPCLTCLKKEEDNRLWLFGDFLLYYFHDSYLCHYRSLAGHQSTKHLQVSIFRALYFCTIPTHNVYWLSLSIYIWFFPAHAQWQIQCSWRGGRLLSPLRIESGGNRKFTNPEVFTTKWLYPKAIGVLLAKVKKYLGITLQNMIETIQSV